MKFRAHETFFIRKGWLSKGMKYVRTTNGEVFISKKENPMDVLGIGSNMVKSLRYWLLATGLSKEPSSGKRTQKLTALGELVYENDRYLEEEGTLQLLHYKLASNSDDATSWYYFFNEFSLFEFTQEDFITSIKAYVKMHNGESGTDRTLSDDFSCIVNTYFSKRGGEKLSPENNISCPFSELGLLSLLDSKKGLYKKSIPSVSAFNPHVVLAVIADNANGRKEIKLNELLQGKRNIGRIFNLDTISMTEILRSAEKTGEVKIIRTAGLDVIQLKNPEKKFLDHAKEFYQSLANSVIEPVEMKSAVSAPLNHRKNQGRNK